MPGSFSNLLSINLIAKAPIANLENFVTDNDYQTLVERLDRWMFGKNGSLAKSLKSQAGREGITTWLDLTEKYYEWKERMMETGRSIPGEKIPPKEVISTDIWVRTGKIREFVWTHDKGRFKTIRIHPGGFFHQGTFLEWFVEKIEYWIHADTRRPLFVFTDEDREKLTEIVLEWLKAITSHYFAIQAVA